MSVALHECLNNVRLNRSIEKFAYRLAQRFPDTFDIEDSKQELWLEIIRKAGTSHSTLHMVKLAEDAVYSKYGRTLLRPALHSDKEMIRDVDIVASQPSPDRSMELIEARATLDQIHARIESLGKPKLSRVFTMYRDDMPGCEIADTLGLSRSRVSRMQQEIIEIATAM